jgi:uncharacterized protein (DUF2336 family)
MEEHHQHDRRLRPSEGPAIAQTGSAEACLAALENPRASLTPSAIAGIAARYGHVGVVREALFARPDLPPAVRLSLVRQLSGVLAGLAASRGWLARDRAEQMRRETCEQAAVAIAALHSDAVNGMLRRFAAQAEARTGPQMGRDFG